MTPPINDAEELSDEHLAALSAEFERAPASHIVRWAATTFADRIFLAASFQDAVLIDIATKVKPDIEVVFIDTGDHFDETYEMVDLVARRYSLNLTVHRVPEPAVPFHLVDPVTCCSDAKVAELEKALSGRDAWMSGLRRVEAETRADAPILSRDRRGKVKVNPLATWTDLDVAGYVADHDVPVHPLIDQGYPSIGCRYTTTPVEGDAHPRSGRWAGTDKTECGLHL